MGTDRRAERHSLSAIPATDSTDQIDRPLQRRRTTSVGKLTQFFQAGSMRERSGSNYFQSALQDFSIAGKLSSKIAESQKRGADSLARWAHSAQNAAIDDVMQQTSQLFSMFAERQLQFVREYTHSLQQLQKMADAERTVKDAERGLRTLEDKERKLKREIRRGVSFFRQRRGGDICMLRQQLEDVKVAKDVADRSLQEIRAEMEVVKMFRFRHGMQGMADAYRGLAQSCQAIFTCHREITELVPAVSNQDVRRMMYDGTPVSRHRVEDLRRSLESGFNVSGNTTTTSSRRRSEPIRSRAPPNRYHTPPPPYTPSAPPDQAVPQPRHHVSDSQLIRHSNLNAAIQRSPAVVVATTTSCAQQLDNQSSSPTIHSGSSRSSSDRSEPPVSCAHCGRIYPELSPNPYKQIAVRSAHHDGIIA